MEERFEATQVQPVAEIEVQACFATSTTSTPSAIEGQVDGGRFHTVLCFDELDDPVHVFQRGVRCIKNGRSRGGMLTLSSIRSLLLISNLRLVIGYWAGFDAQFN